MARSGVESFHRRDVDGNPAGGMTHGRGIQIRWQNGPLSIGGSRVEPNGAFVEDVIEAAIDRIQFYQRSKFACDYNAEALLHLAKAKDALDRRTVDRDARGVEGTHEV